MRNIEYIIIEDSADKGSACSRRNSCLSQLGHCHVVQSEGLERHELIDLLVDLRRHYPKAKILGRSEIVSKANGEKKIIVSEAMNGIRREMSDLV